MCELSVILMALCCLHAWHTTAFCPACDGTVMKVLIEFNLIRLQNVYACSALQRGDLTGRIKRAWHNTGLTRWKNKMCSA